MTQVASDFLHIPIKILRLGQISGHSKSGYWTTEDMIPILIQASALLGAFPIVNGHIDWIPSDVAAQSIHDILMSKPIDMYTVYNITNPHRVPWSELVPILQSSGVLSPTVREISISEWVLELDKEGTKGTPFPGLQLLSFFESMALDHQQFRKFVTEKATRASNALRVCPEFHEGWMNLYVQSWRDKGFLQKAV